jgi:hypothetical protein
MAAWARALASHAHAERKYSVGAAVVYDHWDGVNSSKRRRILKAFPRGPAPLEQRSRHLASTPVKPTSLEKRHLLSYLMSDVATIPA